MSRWERIFYVSLLIISAMSIGAVMAISAQRGFVSPIGAVAIGSSVISVILNGSVLVYGDTQ